MKKGELINMAMAQTGKSRATVERHLKKEVIEEKLKYWNCLNDLLGSHVENKNTSFNLVFDEQFNLLDSFAKTTINREIENLLELINRKNFPKDITIKDTLKKILECFKCSKQMNEEQVKDAVQMLLGYMFWTLEHNAQSAVSHLDTIGG
jgi:hypothetical protein